MHGGTVDRYADLDAVRQAWAVGSYEARVSRLLTLFPGLSAFDDDDVRARNDEARDLLFGGAQNDFFYVDILGNDADFLPLGDDERRELV